MFGPQEVVHQFDPIRTPFIKLLVMSGCFKSYKEALGAGWDLDMEVPEEWTQEIINGVAVYVYNPPDDFVPENERVDPYGDDYDPPWFMG